MQVTRTTDAQTLQDALVQLQQCSLLARYGDVFKELCTTLRCQAEALKVDGWQSLSKTYWTQIQAKLVEEQDAYKKLHQGMDTSSDCYTHIAISQACTAVGFHMKDMLAAIHCYALRNEMVHSNLTALIEAGSFFDLAKILHDDLCDVRIIIASEHVFVSDMIVRVIEALVDLWFDRDLKEPENYQLWTATEELRRRRGEFVTADRNNGEITKEIRASITKKVQMRLRKERERETKYTR